MQFIHRHVRAFVSLVVLIYEEGHKQELSTLWPWIRFLLGWSILMRATLTRNRFFKLFLLWWDLTMISSWWISTLYGVEYKKNASLLVQGVALFLFSTILKWKKCESRKYSNKVPVALCAAGERTKPFPAVLILLCCAYFSSTDSRK